MGLGKTTSPSNPGNTNYATSTGTTTGSTAPPDWLSSAYRDLITRSQGVASTGYQPYTGGFTAQQQAAFGNIDTVANQNNPLYQAQTGAAAVANTPTYNTVANYMNPYTEGVIKATMANMQEQNAQQQQGVIGNAISKGAFGGNRVGVAQAELARQQNLANQQTIAGLYNQNYAQALAAAQAQQQASLGAAGAYGNVAQQQLGAAGAQLQSGTQQQQFDYSQYLNQMAFPYAQQSWLGSQYGSIGPLAGGTTSQNVSQTSPEGNALSGLLGAGLSVASLFSDERVKDDIRPVGKTFDGQPIYTYRYKGSPTTHMGLIAQNVAGKHPDAVNDNNGILAVDYRRATDDAARKGHFAQGGVVPYGGSDMPYGVSGEPYANDNKDFALYVPLVAHGGGSPSFGSLSFTPPSSMMPSVTPLGSTARAHGGAVRGYAPGGVIGSRDWLNESPSPYVDPAWGPSIDDYADQPPPADNPADVAVGSGAEGVASPFEYAAQPDNQVVPSSRGVIVMPPNYAPTGLAPAGVVSGPQFVTEPTPGYSQNIGDMFQSLKEGRGLNLAPDVQQGLLAAGLGMMAGDKPFAMQNIGAGGLQGIKTWQERQAIERENAKARSDIGYQQGTLQQQAQRLWQDAQRNAADIAKIGVETAAERYPAAPGMTGMVMRDVTQPTVAPKVIPYDMSAGAAPAPASGTPAGGVNAPALGGVEAPSATPKFDAEGNVSFDVEPPANIPMNNMGFNQVGQQVIAGQTQQAMTEARKNYTVAQDMGMQLQIMRNEASLLPANGILSQGPGLGARAAAVKQLNTLLAIAGFDERVAPEEVASVESLNKLTTQFGFNLSKVTGSDVASSVVQQAISAVPSVENSPQGFQTIIASIQAGLNRQKDYYNFLQKWTARTGGDVTGADAYFNQVAPPSAYADAALMTSAVTPTSQAEIDNAPPGTLFNINGQLMVK